MVNHSIKGNNLSNVTIIIPNYNGLRYIKVCINSLSKQYFKNFNIIIVDNASQDGSVEFIKNECPGVRLIELKENYGFSRAVNDGIKASDNEYIVLLNNDTEVEQDWLYSLVECMERDENIFSCSSKMVRYHDRTKIDDAGDEYNILGWANKRGDGLSIDSYDRNTNVFSSCAGAAIYRKSMLDKIGLFDESFFAYMEDVDLSYRAKIYGYKNIYCNDAIVYHIGSATSGSKYNSFKVRLAARNNIYVVYKNMPILQLIINGPFLLAGLAIKYIFFSKLGFGKEYKHGISEAFLNLKNVKKVKYNNKNLMNYVRIEIEMVLNTFKYMYVKIGRVIRKP